MHFSCLPVEEFVRSLLGLVGDCFAGLAEGLVDGCFAGGWLDSKANLRDRSPPLLSKSILRRKSPSSDAMRRSMAGTAGFDEGPDTGR